MGMKPKKPKEPAPLPPPTRPENEDVQQAGQNTLRKLYRMRGRDAQRMSEYNTTTGGM